MRLNKAVEILKATAKIDQTGHLSLNIPTQMAAGLVDVVVVVNPASSSQLTLPQYDFSDLAGRLGWKGDAVAMQRSLRDEW